MGNNMLFKIIIRCKINLQQSESEGSTFELYETNEI